MNDIKISKQTVITSIAWHEIDEQLDYLPLEDALNDRVRLSAFGSGVQSITCTFIAVKPDNQTHEEYTHFDPGTHELRFSVKLDYDQIESATPGHTLKQCGEGYLKGVRIAAGEVGHLEFDWSKYIDQVTHVFHSKGWIIQP